MLNWVASSAISIELGAELSRRDALAQVAFGERPRRLGQTAQRGGEAPGQDRRDHDAQTQREERDRGEQAGDVGQGCRTERVRVREGDLDRVRLEERAGRSEDRSDGRVLLGLPLLRDRAERDVELAVLGRHEDRHIRARIERSEADADVGLGKRVGQEPPGLVAREQLGHGRVQRVVEHGEAARADLVPGEGLDGAEHRLRADLEVRPLLLGEVVVEPVDDEHGDERQRHRDQQDQRDGQARLEGLGAEVPDAATER